MCEFSGEYELCMRVWRKTMASYHLNQIKLSQMVSLIWEMLIFILKSNKIIATKYIYIITVKASLEPGWLEGTLNGKTGLVPKNYVEQLP